MVPQRLNDWTYEAVQNLCNAGQSESDWHDFKFNLPAPNNATKICCAFANTFGGFIVLGVKEFNQERFEISGLDPDKELYGRLLAKVKADPQIDVSSPRQIHIPQSTKFLYVFEIPQSTRRPHLPAVAEERFFWKRQGSDCVRMTLEEIRYQMNTYEEKREQLTLLLIDLHNKMRSLSDQSTVVDGHYFSETFTFEIIDRVVADTFSLLKADMSIFGALEAIKRNLSSLNREKQQLMSLLSLSYNNDFKMGRIDGYRQKVRDALPRVGISVEQIESSLKEKYGIENPYKT